LLRQAAAARSDGGGFDFDLFRWVPQTKGRRGDPLYREDGETFVVNGEMKGGLHGIC
jgi:hypothetical protein